MDDRRLPPVTQLGMASLALIVAGGIYLASHLPKHVPLAPAVIRTEMVASMPPEQVKYMTDKIPMKRCGTLEEFAATAEFIVSPENSFTTAFTFDLSGGRAVY